MKPLTTYIAGLLAVFLTGCDELPRDPDRLTDRVRSSGKIQVGLIHNPPWVNTHSGPVPIGFEVEMIKSFADSLGAKPEWKPVSMDEGFYQIKEKKLDVLIGGITTASPYKEVGLTRPYFTWQPRERKEPQKHVIAVQRGENRFIVELEKFLKSQSGLYVKESKL